MNAVIRELFYTAKFEPDRCVDGIYYPYIALQAYGEPWRHTITDDGVQKFVELIVEECIKELSGTFDNVNDDEADYLRRHFGINNER